MVGFQLAALVTIVRIFLEGDTLPLLVLFTPFLLDAAISAAELTRQVVYDDNNLRERLLVKREPEVPSDLETFLHLFCAQSPVKQKVFLLSTTENFETQLTVFGFIMVQFYFGLLSFS